MYDDIVTTPAVLEVFRRLGSIQFDPIAVAGRSHDLVLHARVADYDPAWCELLYERRAIFEGTVGAGERVLTVGIARPAAARARVAHLWWQHRAVAFADHDQRLAPLLQPAHADDQGLDGAERHVIADGLGLLR